MSATVNLADPDFEPSDAELAGLAARAFEGARRVQAEALRRLQDDVATARERALHRLESRIGAEPTDPAAARAPR